MDPPLPPLYRHVWLVAYEYPGPPGPPQLERRGARAAAAAAAATAVQCGITCAEDIQLLPANGIRAAAEAIRRLARETLDNDGDMVVARRLTAILGLSTLDLHVARVAALLAYAPVRAEFAALRAEYIRSGDSDLPVLRLTLARLLPALDVNRPSVVQNTALCPLRRTGAPTEYTTDYHQRRLSFAMWSAEDFYARFILRVLEAIYREPDPDAHARLTWLRRPRDVDVKMQVWILYHVCLFLHWRAKVQLWKSQTFGEKVVACLNGERRRYRALSQ